MDKAVISDVGKRIARYRKMKDLTQFELGEMLGRNQSVISSWEKGIDPGSDNLILLSHALGVTPNDLLGFQSSESVEQIVMPDDSMEPLIHKGDILTVDTAGEAQNGDTVLVDTHKGKGLIRRLFKISAQYMLLSFSPSIPPISVHNVDIKGKVTDIHRKL